jgi:hypothetical protein
MLTATTPTAQPAVQDAEGENKAVRSFLMLYGQPGLTVGKMKKHMAMSDFKSWPTWVETEPHGAHLTKAGAQLWIRHLFALEATPHAQPAPTVQDPVIQRVMSRLADLLDEDQFKEIEGMVVVAGCTPPTQPAPAPVQEPKQSPPFTFRRFVAGSERAQDVAVHREITLDAAIRVAAKICPPSESGHPTVLVYTPPPAQLLAVAWPTLTADEREALERFHETWQDDQGYDVPKPMMTRLAKLGVVYSEGFGRYGMTTFGLAVLQSTPPAAPVPLTDEQVDSATKAWFENDIVAGRNPFRKRMRAAFAAAHGITKGQK